MVGEQGCSLLIKVEGGDTGRRPFGPCVRPHTPLPWRHSVPTEGCEYLVISYGEGCGDACVSTRYTHTRLRHTSHPRRDPHGMAFHIHRSLLVSDHILLY